MTNNSTGNYTFSGSGAPSGANPELTLERGKTYIFNVDAPDHPFFINTENSVGTGSGYTPVQNNGQENGSVQITVPNNAPNVLHYNCQFHSSMNGKITITGGATRGTGP